jgi:phosphosulfolactate phosphohydrolase-like enzyme
MVDDVMGGAKAQSLRRDVNMSVDVLCTVSEVVRILAYSFGYILAQK